MTDYKRPMALIEFLEGLRTMHLVMGCSVHPNSVCNHQRELANSPGGGGGGGI